MVGGKLNVITKVGNSTNAQAQVLGLDDGMTMMMAVGKANNLQHYGNDTTVMGAYGNLNVAVKSGDGLMIAATVGQGNLVVHNGDDTLGGFSYAWSPKTKNDATNPSTRLDTVNKIGKNLDKLADDEKGTSWGILDDPYIGFLFSKAPNQTSTSKTG
ncbi:hypothetical protein [Breoghania sp.]|uniref:hypothetical protein n=1 Tax=Breoghania sp. TaxID=2065378 RepID=UPI002623BA72|nr:hypothetical protein [Breoghania sp.]MDJ0933440.1 hypothetical protein [Breoghania sp.]